VIAPSSNSFHRPASPSERRRVTLVKSSRKPIAPQATVTAKTVSADSVYSLRTRNGSAEARTISTPPIVGVPCLVRWPAGPSSRMCWPSSLRRRNSMNFGPAMIDRTIANRPAAMTLSICSS
jgi:hypothetical protein